MAGANGERKVLLISSDKIGTSMAGPGIRYYEMARLLARRFEVTLAAPAGSSRPEGAPSGLRLVLYEYKTNEREILLPLVEWAEVVVIQGTLALDPAEIKARGKFLAVDLYHPFTLETMQVQKHDPAALSYRRQLTTENTRLLDGQLAQGDFFFCGSEKQRDYWLGALTALNRLNPLTHDDDPRFRRLIDLVPFGLPDAPPRHTRPVLKGVMPGIGENDKVLLWGGGIWEWFDALTLLRAMRLVAEQRQDVKLFFMGIRHPNPIVPVMKACQDALDLAGELGLTGRYVFFNDWTPYDERQNYLAEADIGVSLHLDHIETRFSLRTRLMDYIWAGLPVITTGGDSLSELVERQNLGRVVAERDVEGVARAILELAALPDLKAGFSPAFEGVRASLTWEKVLQPLVDYCAAPYHAADWETEESGAAALTGGMAAQAELHLLRHKLENLEKVYGDTAAYAKNLEAELAAKAAYIEQLEASLGSSPALAKQLLKQLRARLPRS